MNLTEKYRPKTLGEIVGNTYQVNIITDWLTKRLKNSRGVKRVLLIHGQAGTGKTTLVQSLCNDFKLNLNEINASDSRRKDDLKKIRKQIDNLSLEGKKTLTFFDEVDGLKNFSQLKNICKKTKSPIVLACNEIAKIPPTMKELCFTVPFNPTPDRTECLTFLKEICEKEKMNVLEKDLKEIIKRNPRIRDQLNALEAKMYGGDIEEAINIWKTVDLILRGKIKPEEMQFKVQELFFILWSKMPKTRENIDKLNWINNHLKDGTEEKYLRQVLLT